MIEAIGQESRRYYLEVSAFPELARQGLQQGGLARGGRAQQECQPARLYAAVEALQNGDVLLRAADDAQALQDALQTHPISNQSCLRVSGEVNRTMKTAQKFYSGLTAYEGH